MSMEILLSTEQVEILKHTLHRAPGGHYCGDSSDMQFLVIGGYMKSLGNFLGNPYFGITPKGRDYLKNNP
jgi:hypothetical protein